VKDTAEVDIGIAAAASKKQIEERQDREAEEKETKARVDAIKKQNAADDARIAEEKKRKDKADAELAAREAEATRKEKAEARIKANAEAVRNKQEAQESLAAMKKDAAAKQASEKAREREDEILRSTKTTSAQRIAARNRIDAMTRQESRRIEDANARITRQPGMKQITPDTIKASIKSAAGKAPAKLSNVTTSMFGGVSESLIGQPSSKSSAKFFKQETQLMSKAVKPHATNPIFGGSGKATPKLKGTQVAVAPNYIDSLLGRSTDRVRTHPKKGGGMFSGLDNFIKRI
jgi:hypothetical protein